MASRTKKPSTTKRTTKRKTRKSAQTKKENFVVYEIFIWITLAVSIFILISNFGFGGRIGDAVSGFLKGLIGIAAYFFPFLLFGAVTITIANKGNHKIYLKELFIAILYFQAILLLELTFKAGGSIGASITDVLRTKIGTAGTVVVVCLVIIICVVVITEKSLLKQMKAETDKAQAKMKQGAKQRKESRIELKKEKEKERKLHIEREKDKQIQEDETKQKPSRRRTEKKVSGVSFGTTLGKKKSDLQELIPMEQPLESPPFEIDREAPFEEDQPKEEIKPVKKVKMSAKDMENEIHGVENIIASGEKIKRQNYQFPPLSLLKKGKKGGGESDSQLRQTARKLEETLQNFGVSVTVTNVSCGPSVTRYEIQPEQGVKVSKIVGLTDDIKLNLAAADIRIEAPIPGKAAVGIEVPNKEQSTVMLRDLLETTEFQSAGSKLSFAAGRDLGGRAVVADIAKMPHLLVAGATGSGKSVCMNTLIMSILYKASPDEVKLIMVDPKVVELSVYNGIPHLMIPVVTDPKKAAGALNWAVAEMTRRYQQFADNQVRDIKGFNEKFEQGLIIEEEGKEAEKMPQIVIIVDELADLMMVAPGEVEEAICRLAQLARAAGIHLVLATQRPSVNVITGLIKANMPSRIAFSVSSGVDSRTIIDMNGAEKLLGKGDMLFYPSGYQKPVRVQGAFVSDTEVQSVVEYLKNKYKGTSYNEEVEEHVNLNAAGSGNTFSLTGEDDRDVYFAEAGKFIIEKERASIGMLQRVFKIGFNRAARIMDQLCEAGVVGPEEGTKPRKILMTMEEFDSVIDQ